jgi:hypothetical protein
VAALEAAAAVLQRLAGLAEPADGLAAAAAAAARRWHPMLAVLVEPEARAGWRSMLSDSEPMSMERRLDAIELSTAANKSAIARIGAETRKNTANLELVRDELSKTSLELVMLADAGKRTQASLEKLQDSVNTLLQYSVDMRADWRKESIKIAAAGMAVLAAAMVAVLLK